MRSAPVCVRCSGPLRPPGLWSSAWACDAHGEVAPLHLPTAPSPELLSHVARQARVPAWLPWPLPSGWVVTGVAHAGDDRTGAVGVAVACTGPGLLGGAAELLLVAEEPGVGLGARYAGLGSTDPGPGFDLGAPHAKVHAGGHPTALWCLEDVGGGAEAPVAFVGEAAGCWLWALVWPQDAAVVLYDDLVLHDLRDLGALDVPLGAASPRLLPPAPLPPH